MDGGGGGGGVDFMLFEAVEADYWCRAVRCWPLVARAERGDRRILVTLMYSLSENKWYHPSEIVQHLIRKHHKFAKNKQN